MYDIEEIRARFPALTRTVAGRPVIHLDGPAGTQVPRSVIDAIASALVTSASNQGGVFAASVETDATVSAARRAGADLVGGQPEEIVFGQNMTTLTFAMSRALARGWRPGDRILVTRLDHDANVTPWVAAAEDVGAEIVFCDIDPGDVSIDMGSLESAIDNRTRIVAVSGCSNTFGTRVDLARVATAAHSVGALCYVDAVHLAPHVRIDVASSGVDMLVCSAYKFHGPHVGMLWGRHEILDEIQAYKVRPAPSEAPGRFETGTPSFSNLAGVTAAIDHLASLGVGTNDETSRPELLDRGFASIAQHEADIGGRFLDGLPERVRVWGRPTMDGRVPTFAITIEGIHPADVAKTLSEHGIYTWAGHNYAVEPVTRLGLMDSGGVVRVGLMNTTTHDEVDRTLEVLSSL